MLHKTDKDASAFIKMRKRLPKNSRTVLLHTRFATKGHQSEWANNHPVLYGTVFTTHNGTIRNDDRLFDKYELKGRAGQVDSEIIPALLDHFTFDRAEKAFEEFTGGFATASVDPVRYPGVVLLAKNSQWPLIVHENKHFFVWASTKDAIKEAWGAVLGTPPSNYVELTGGDMWFLGKDGSKDTGSFKTYSWSVSNTSTRNRWDNWEEEESEPWWGGMEYDAGDDWKGRTYASKKSKGFITLDNANAVQTLRSEGRAMGITYLRRGDEGNAEYLEKHGDGKWSYCVHCKQTVANCQILNTNEWGEICVDCYAIGKSQKNEDQDFQAWVEGFGMTLDEYKMLEQFCDLSTYIHLRAITQVSTKFGMKRTVVEHLLQRASVDYLESNKALTDLYCELHDAYEDSVAELWLAWTKEQEAAERKALPAGDACGVEPFQEERVEKLGRCMVCGRKPRVFLGTTLAWCKKHANTCAVDVDNPYSEKCGLKPVSTASRGVRLCHTHSRGIKGLMADNDKAARTRAHKELVNAA